MCKPHSPIESFSCKKRPKKKSFFFFFSSCQTRSSTHCHKHYGDQQGLLLYKSIVPPNKSFSYVDDKNKGHKCSVVNPCVIKHSVVITKSEEDHNSNQLKVICGLILKFNRHKLSDFYSDNFFCLVYLWF